MPVNDLNRFRLVVAEERELILSGRIAELPALASRKEACLSVCLKASRRSATELAAIRRDLVANQFLLDAAAKGIRAAQTRIAEIRAVGTSLSAYNARGENVRHGQGTHTLERRA